MCYNNCLFVCFFNISPSPLSDFNVGITLRNILLFGKNYACLDESELEYDPFTLHCYKIECNGLIIKCQTNPVKRKSYLIIR